MARWIAVLPLLLVACAKSHTADGAIMEPADLGLAARGCDTPVGTIWGIVITDAPVDCDTVGGGVPPPGLATTIGLLSDLTSVGFAFPVNTSFARETALFNVCNGPSACRFGVSGSVTVERLTIGVEIVLRWTVQLDDGTTDSGRARIVDFCTPILC